MCEVPRLQWYTVFQTRFLPIAASHVYAHIDCCSQRRDHLCLTRTYSSMSWSEKYLEFNIYHSSCSVLLAGELGESFSNLIHSFSPSFLPPSSLPTQPSTICGYAIVLSKKVTDTLPPSGQPLWPLGVIILWCGCGFYTKKIMLIHEAGGSTLQCIPIEWSLLIYYRSPCRPSPSLTGQTRQDSSSPPHRIRLTRLTRLTLPHISGQI